MAKKLYSLTLIPVLSVLSVLSLLSLSAPATATEPMLYELRTYTANDGKFEALQNRFRNHTLKLFARHGMTNVGYWVPVDQTNTLVYLLAHKNAAAAKTSWQGFINDPDWKKVAEQSNANGPLISNIEKQFMSATDYSPLR